MTTSADLRAEEWGAHFGFRHSKTPFSFSQLADGRRRRRKNEWPLSLEVADHPYFFRDERGVPKALAVHLYDPDPMKIARVCIDYGLDFEIVDNRKLSWWNPGVTTLVIYRPRP